MQQVLFWDTKYADTDTRSPQVTKELILNIDIYIKTDTETQKLVCNT